MMMQVAIDAYMTSLDRMSMSTRSAYQKDLDQLYQYLQAQGVENWGVVTSEQITAYLTEELCKTHGYQQSTITRKFAATRSFFRYLCGSGGIPLNPTEKVAHPGSSAQWKEVPQMLSQKQIDCLLEQTDEETSAGLRDNALLRLLLCTGMLTSEVLSLNLGDIRLADGMVLLPSGQGGQKKKNSRDRVLPIESLAVKAIQRYLEQGRPFLVRDPLEQALFLNQRNGERLSRQGFWLLIKGYAKVVGVTITPRVLRRTCVVRMLDAGMDLHDVQQLLGITMANIRRYVAASTTGPEQAEAEVTTR